MHTSWKCGALIATLLVVGQGCGSSLSQPFEQAKGQPVRMLRLQNFEPQQTQAQPAGNLGQNLLPPQIQQWLSAGAQLLPPGLLPPGLLPGGTPTPTQQADAPRFHGFRILGWMDIADSKKRDEVLDIFGRESNFTTQHGGCLFAEFGFSVGQPNGQPPSDLLVSLSCDNTQAFSFAWPYPQKTGFTTDVSKRIVDLAKGVFGG